MFRLVFSGMNYGRFIPVPKARMAAQTPPQSSVGSALHRRRQSIGDHTKAKAESPGAARISHAAKPVLYSTATVPGSPLRGSSQLARILYRQYRPSWV